MRKILFITYFSFVAILFLSYSYSIIYDKKLHDIIYEKYLPEIRINPQYDLKTGEVANKDEVNFWSAADYVPWYGFASYKTYYFTKSNGIFFLIFALLLYFPMLICNRKNIKIIYWIILAFEITMCFYLWGTIFD